MFRSHWLPIGVLWWLSSSAYAAPAEVLFSNLDGQPPEGSAVAVQAGATWLPRLVRVRAAQLDDARRAVEQGREAALTVNLAADAIYRVIVEHTAPTSSGYSLAGRIADMPEGRMVLVVNGDILAGTVWTRRGAYAIRTEGAGVYAVERLDPKRALPLAEPRVLPLPDGAGKPPGTSRRSPNATHSLPAPSARNEDVQVDVLVLWAPAARVLAGGLRRLRAAVDNMVATANDAYRKGGVAQRLHLAGAAELSYRNATPDDIDLLPDADNGFLDEIHLLRDSYAADIVSVIVEFDIGGIALLMVELAPGSEMSAFNMVNISADPTIFAHELGHNMGLQHDRYTVRKSLPPDEQPPDDFKLALFPYSFGYVNQGAFNAGRTCWHTIMSYPDQCDDAGIAAVGLPRFSHAEQRYPTPAGDFLGVPLDAPDTPLHGPTHAARSLNEARHVVANFRDAATRCDYALSADGALLPESVEVPAEGGAFTVRVDTAAHCVWQAHHQTDFVTVAPTAVQTGRGEVTYTAQPNAGAPRAGVASIAAETFAVRQTGLQAPLAVCERTPPVRRAIESALAEEDCTAVNVWDLQRVTMLEFDEPLRLRAEDFDGLVNLTGLRVYPADGDLSALAGLVNLRSLDALDGGIVDLSPLAGLTRLQYLDLADNRIVDLTPLGNLRELLLLTLRGNAIADLTPLAALTGLFSLDVADNRIDDISPLAGLPFLFVLSLNDNAIKDLSPLAGKTYLGVLQASGNRVEDAAPLLRLPALRQADLTRNPLTEETVYDHIAVLEERDVQMRYDPAARRQGWRLAFLSGEDLHR